MENDAENPILISNRNLEKYGFACFYHGLHPGLIDGYWIREVEIAAGGGAGFKQKKFRIPEHLLIKLSRARKIVDNENFNIGSGNLPGPIIKLLSERAGWNQTDDDLKLMIKKEKQGVFIATYDHNRQAIPLGSGVSLPVNKDLCWIGMILVHPELRRQGIARHIMQACLAYGRSVQRKSIIGLDATPLGKQVYDSLGFKDSYLIWRSVISVNIKSIDFPGFKLESSELKLVRNYLLRKNYAERLHIIELLSTLPDSKNIIASNSSGMKGFVMSRSGRLKPFIGPLIADSSEVAHLLLKGILNYWKDLGHENVFMDIPEQHIGRGQLFVPDKTSNINTDNQIEVTPVRSLMRMYQLISKENDFATSVQMDHAVRKQAMHGFEKTMTFMEKEKNDIVPMMYGTSGPEWS